MSKRYNNGRARLYPKDRKGGSSLKKVTTPKKIEMNIDTLDEENGRQSSPVSVFKVMTSHEKANQELEKMRIEQMDRPQDEHLGTENATISGVERGSTETVGDDMVVLSPPPRKPRSRSNSVL